MHAYVRSIRSLPYHMHPVRTEDPSKGMPVPSFRPSFTALPKEKSPRNAKMEEERKGRKNEGGDKD
jgi:hypothetical protein